VSVVQQLVTFAQPWADLYNNHTAVQTAVTFGHFGGMMLAGGFALAADRSTLRAARAGEAERKRHLSELQSTHRLVVPALTLTAFTGVLMFAADLESLAGSWAFWVKLGLVGLLLANGAFMLSAERGVQGPARSAERAWGRLRRAAVGSLVLWFAVVLAGTVLQTAS
jgi:hypothetical protein